jgi:hypothetical protein
LLGLSLLVVSGVGLAVLLALGGTRWWRLLLFLPLWGGMLGVLQAQRRT